MVKEATKQERTHGIKIKSILVAIAAIAVLSIVCYASYEYGYDNCFKDAQIALDTYSKVQCMNSLSAVCVKGKMDNVTLNCDVIIKNANALSQGYFGAISTLYENRTYSKNIIIYENDTLRKVKRTDLVK